MNSSNGRSRLPWFVAGTVVGSVLIYFFDPDRGTYRRTKFKEKGIKLKNQISNYSAKNLRHLKNKSQGLKSRATNIIHRKELIDDDVLEARIRSAFGRVVRNPKSINVFIHNGTVTLSGPILSNEVHGLIKRVYKVAGVKDVINNLDEYESSEHIPDLQGEGPSYIH